MNNFATRFSLVLIIILTSCSGENKDKKETVPGYFIDNQLIVSNLILSESKLCSVINQISSSKSFVSFQKHITSHDFDKSKVEEYYREYPERRLENNKLKISFVKSQYLFDLNRTNNKRNNEIESSNEARIIEIVLDQNFLPSFNPNLCEFPAEYSDKVEELVLIINEFTVNKEFQCILLVDQSLVMTEGEIFPPQRSVRYNGESAFRQMPVVFYSCKIDSENLISISYSVAQYE